METGNDRVSLITHGGVLIGPVSFGERLLIQGQIKTHWHKLYTSRRKCNLEDYLPLGRRDKNTGQVKTDVETFWIQNEARELQLALPVQKRCVEVRLCRLERYKQSHVFVCAHNCADWSLIQLAVSRCKQIFYSTVRRRQGTNRGQWVQDCTFFCVWNGKPTV